MRAADNLVRAARRCEPTAGHRREADSLAHCSPPGRHPPSPSAEEPGVAPLLDPQLQSLQRNIQTQKTKDNEWVTGIFI